MDPVRPQNPVKAVDATEGEQLSTSEAAQGIQHIQHPINGLSDASNSLLQHILRLPRELRDEIYTLLWIMEPPETFERSFSRKLMGLLTPTANRCFGPPCSCLHGFPKFIDVNIMGSQFAREALKIYSIIMSSDYPEHHEVRIFGPIIQDFVYGNPFHAGITMERVFRGADLIFVLGCQDSKGERREEQRKMRLVMQAGLFFQDGNDEIYIKGDKWTKNEKLLEQSVRALSSLPIENKIEIGYDKRLVQGKRLKFKILGATMFTSELHALIKTFGPVLQILHKRGFEVIFVLLDDALKLSLQFGAEAWNWTTEEWCSKMIFEQTFTDRTSVFNDDFRSKDQYPFFLSDEDSVLQEQQLAILGMIMQYVYGISTGN